MALRINGTSVNRPATSAHDAISFGAPRQRWRNIGAGVAVSLAVHAALLFAFRYLPDRAAPDEQGVRRESLVVWLRAPEPVVAAPAARVPPPEAPAPRRARAKPRAPASSDLIAIPERAEAALAPDPFALEPAAAPQGGPRFDPEAARKLARQIATEPDSTGVPIPPKPYATETKAARAIARAKRRDCKDGLPGGLLGPLFLLMDKKDSGCKW